MFEINPSFLQFIPTSVGTSWDDEGVDLQAHAGGDIGVFHVPFKCEVVQAQVTITETLSDAAEIKFDLRPTAGSDTDRGDGDIADLNIGVTGVSVQGEVAYDLAGTGTVIDPGEEVVVEVIASCTSSGKVRPDLIVRYLPETLANLDALQETT